MIQVGCIYLRLVFLRLGTLALRGIDADADADKGVISLYLSRFEEVRCAVLRLCFTGLL